MTELFARVVDEGNVQSIGAESEKHVQHRLVGVGEERVLAAAELERELVRFDPALFVTQPEGKEVGYVPIVVRQEAAR